jgi:acetyl esterase
LFATFSEAAHEQSLTGFSSADPLASSIEEARAKQDLYFQSLNQNLPEVSAEKDLEISGPCGNIPIRLVYPKVSGPLPCIIFIRGAGFWAGSLDSHARTIRSLSLLSDCVVCAIDYRRTPEFQYPTQRDEVLQLISWLRQNADQLSISRKFVLFGESAGATIALSCALSLRDRGDREISGLALFYTNAGGPNPSARAYSQWVWKQYLGHDGLSTNSNAVPILDDLHGLPPVWLGVGEDDPLMKDTLEVNRKIIAAGGESTLITYPKLPHAFVMYSGTLKPAYEALKAAALACKDFLNHSK